MKAVLFDLDDTLVDHQHCYRTSLAAVQRQSPALRDTPFETLDRLYNEWLEALHARVLAGALTLHEARLERFRQIFLHCGVALNDDELEAVAVIQRDTYLAAQRPIAGVIDLLAHLQTAGISIGVVTNNLTAEQEAKLEFCGLAGYVDALVTSEAVGQPKPHPAMFHTALERLGCQPDEVVMVGDSWKADILGARQAGIRALWLNRYEHPCPDPSLAAEFQSYIPLEQVLALLQLA